MINPVNYRLVPQGKGNSGHPIEPFHENPLMRLSIRRIHNFLIAYNVKNLKVEFVKNIVNARKM